MFSIDNKEKFMKEKDKDGIYTGNDVLLGFGNDIVIHTNCDLEENSISMFPDCYHT